MGQGLREPLPNCHILQLYDYRVYENNLPILQKEIGTKRDRQYRAGEKELLKIIKRNRLVSQFEPNSANVLAVFKDDKYWLINSGSQITIQSGPHTYDSGTITETYSGIEYQNTNITTNTC